MALKSAIDNLKFDARMVEINLKNQSLTRDELQKHLSQLQDSQGQATEVDIEATDMDDLHEPL